MEEKKVSAEWTTYLGKYFSLSHPSDIRLYEKKNTNITNNKSLLEYFRYDQDEPRITFVVQVSEAKDLASISELSSVAVRRSKKEIYTEIKIKSDSRNGIAFTKEKDGAEETYFFLAGDNIYSFAMTGAAGVGLKDIEKIFDRIVSSVKYL